MARRVVVALCLIVASASSAIAGPSGHRIPKTVVLGGMGGWDYLSLDPETGHLLITRNSHVMVVDSVSGKLLADITGLKGIHGTAFVGNRAYVTEGGANRLAVIDTHTNREIGTIPVGKRPDGILYDPAIQLLFSSNGESGTFTATHEDSPTKFTVLENVPTA